MTTVQQQEGAVGRMLRQEIWNKTRERQTLMSCSLSDGHKRSVVMERNQIKENCFVYRSAMASEWRRFTERRHRSNCYF